MSLEKNNNISSRNKDLKLSKLLGRSQNNAKNSVSDKKHKNNKVLWLLLSVLSVLCLVFIYFLAIKQKSSTRDYESYYSQAEEALEYDRLAATIANKSLEEEVGEDVYDSLVLGADTNESSDLYQDYQNVYGSAADQGEGARRLVDAHEEQIKAKGGITDVEDLEQVFTGNIIDPVAYEAITGKPAEEASKDFKKQTSGDEAE